MATLTMSSYGCYVNPRAAAGRRAASRTLDVAPTQIPEGALRRSFECRRIEIIARRFVAVRVVQNQIHALWLRVRQRRIRVCFDRHEASRQHRGKLSARRQYARRPIGELGGCHHHGRIE